MSKQKRFDFIQNGSSQSWLHNPIHISEHKGILALCKVNRVHAVILFEYLKRIDPSPSDESLQRCIVKIDFGPADKKYSLSVQGRAQHIELLGEAAISDNVKKLYVGRHWFLNTDHVLTTFARIKEKIDNVEDIPTNMVSGKLSGSSITESRCDNCLTYAVHVLDTYKSDLKIVDWNTPLLLKALPLPNFWIRVL